MDLIISAILETIMLSVNKAIFSLRVLDIQAVSNQMLFKEKENK